MSASARRSAERRSGLTALELALVHVANLAVTGSGVAYAALRYLVHPVDELAVVNHPWQPHLQHLHVIVAPLLVLALGVAWRGHVVAAWWRPGRPRGGSGVVLALVALPMVFSGVLIQAAMAPWWRSLWVAVHLVSSGLWLAALVVHLASRRNGAGRATVETAGGQNGASRPG